MESQRYINYSKERHGGEITFIKPSWYDKYSKVLLDSTGHRLDGTSDMFTSEDDFEGQLRMAESCYMAALIAGVKPQEARDVLPNATKTELNMTGFASDWRFFFDLRYYGKTGKPHPDMKLLASKARSEFMKAGLWDNIMACPTKFDKDDCLKDT
jgi:thymidylate synthase (FAD)